MCCHCIGGNGGSSNTNVKEYCLTYNVNEKLTPAGFTDSTRTSLRLSAVDGCPPVLSRRLSQSPPLLPALSLLSTALESSLRHPPALPLPPLLLTALQHSTSLSRSLRHFQPLSSPLSTALSPPFQAALRPAYPCKPVHPGPAK